MTKPESNFTMSVEGLAVCAALNLALCMLGVITSSGGLISAAIAFGLGAAYFTIAALYWGWKALKDSRSLD